MRQTAEQLFDDNVRYNSMLAKRKQKHKMKWPDRFKIDIKELLGGLMVTKEEVVKRLKELGVNITSPNTLRNWEKWGLIPQAIYRNSRRTEYPEQTPAEGYACYSRIHDKNFKLSKEKTAQVRKIILELERDPERLRNYFSYPEIGEDGKIKFHPETFAVEKQLDSFAARSLIIDWVNKRSVGEAGPLPPGMKVETIYNIYIDDGKIERSLNVNDTEEGIRIQVWFNES